MEFVTLTIKELEKEDAKKLKGDLACELKKIGIELSIREMPGYTLLNFDYDVSEVKRKLTRGAGLMCKNANTVYISVEDCMIRMNCGEKAEDIAKELGISRATLFRRLKAAKIRNISEISVYDTQTE